MTKKEKATSDLLDILRTTRDPTIAHLEAEQIILLWLKSRGDVSVAKAFEKVRDRIGFWYE